MIKITVDAVLLKTPKIPLKTDYTMTGTNDLLQKNFKS